MKKEIQNRIVHIALPKGKEKKHKHFSGYILGDGIIITCRHGFADQDAYDQQRPIQIISQENKYTIDFNSFDIKGLLDEGIILFESATYDIVLLRCEQASAKFEGLLTNKLEESGKWTGGGYPYYSRANSDTDGLELFSGEFEIVVSAGNYLQLYVNTKLPCMNDWHEISGSPVFIREKLAGIICRYFEYDSKGKKVIIPHRLTAVYLQRLWDDPDEPEFQQIVQEKLCCSTPAFRGKIKALFDRYGSASKLQDQLAAYLKVEKSSLLDAVLRLKKLELMNMCSILRKKENPQGINELLLYGMAFCYENDAVACACFTQQPTKEKPYIDVPVVRVEACEFLMASQDGRDPKFRKTIGKSGKIEVLPRKYNIISPPEHGIHPEAGDDIMTQILAGRADLQAVKERIFADFRRSEHASYDKEKRHKMALALLKREEGTYYWLLEVSAGNASQLQDVSNLPISILNIPDDPDGSLELREEELFSELSVFVED